MARAAAGTFPSAATLLSRAVWYTLDHPAVIGLGLLGSGPAAVLFLLFWREAGETVFLAGTTAETVAPLAFGLAAVYLARFPFRLALAHWMAQQRQGRAPSVAAGLWFALVHLPTALFYGSLTTLSWILGLVLLFPLIGLWRGSLAFHTFASSSRTAREALRDTRRVPLSGLGWRLLSVAHVVALIAFLVFWTSPGALLGLAEWFGRADVSALQAVLGAGSLVWAGTALVLSVVVAELLWSVAFGLLAAEWERVSLGSDLAAELALFESREGRPEAFVS